MNKHKLTGTLLILTTLLAIACLLPIFSSSTVSLAKKLPSRITLEQYTIELSSPSQNHRALTNSEFQLNITANSTATNLAIDSNVNAIANSSASLPLQADVVTQTSQIQLHKPVISLQMLQMDCGVVTTELEASSTTSYSAHAAPLMKGVWLATATFGLEEGSDEVVILSYQFEVT